MLNFIKDFFGLVDPVEDQYESASVWSHRRLNLMVQNFGDLVVERLRKTDDAMQQSDHDNVIAVEETSFDCRDNGGPTTTRMVEENVVEEEEEEPTTNSSHPEFYRYATSYPLLCPHVPIMPMVPKFSAIDQLRYALPTGHQNTPTHLNFGNVIHSTDFDIHNEVQSSPFEGIQMWNSPHRQKRSPLKFSCHPLGWINKLFSFHFKHESNTQQIFQSINKLYLYRPYFTYWITTVHFIILLIGLIGNGFAPVEFQFMITKSSFVRQPNMALEWICRTETTNLWFGPRQVDLVHMGASYTPCIRHDPILFQSIINPQRQQENETACCIRNDGSGCYQTSRRGCSRTLSTWQKWPQWHDNGSGLILPRFSGTVCGQDPRYCTHPISVRPYEWPDSIVDWPVCESTRTPTTSVRDNLHMHCSITGRPCCVDIKGECVITTQEHCQFLRGHFHPEATLCSQINCLHEVCGMLPFKQPNQIYRLFTSLFVHAGILHFVITAFIHFVFVRDIEKMIGWFRTSFIYLLSGFVGNLMSAIFAPYQVKTGPSGGIVGLLGVIFIELLVTWNKLKSPKRSVFKYFLFIFFLTLLGLMPFLDNWCNFTALLSGALLAIIVLPYVTPNIVHHTHCLFKYRRVFVLIIATLIWLMLVGMQFLVFYQIPMTECRWCRYFNCLPFAGQFCDDMDVQVSVRSECLLQDWF